MPLKPQQLDRLQTLERVASCFSLIGTLFIFITFISSSNFRRPINRLVFYASWGNIFCNIGTLMSLSGVRAGPHSHLCRFQAFLIQMFVPADAYWNLAMALNVYLTLFRKYNAQQLKAQEWKYHLACYGMPFVVAMSCLFAESQARGKIFGPATIWCWISPKWEFLRIALCYAPAWVCIVVAFSIYLAAGREIFKKRRQLREFNPGSRSGTIDEPAADSWATMKTTHIAVTTELGDNLPMTITSDTAFAPTKYEKPLPIPIFEKIGKNAPSPGEHSDKRPALTSLPKGSKFEPYSVSIASVGPFKSAQRPSMPDSMLTAQARRNRAALEANKAAWGYTKVAILFFVSLLVTWVPSSANRVWALAHPEKTNVGLAYIAGLVLSLMGFWNSIIYITTSRAACTNLVVSIFSRGKSHRRSLSESRKQPRPLVSRRKSGQSISWGDDFKRLSDPASDSPIQA